jgi:hypothetical protein
MNYTTEEIDTIVKSAIKDSWREVLDMVEEVAPEDAEIIKQHAHICLSLFYQGMRRGWTAGARFLVEDLQARDEAALKAGVRTLQ